MGKEETPDIAQPTLDKRPSLSLIWLVPLITLAIGGWLVFKTISDKGPTITLHFANAADIEAGKTRIKYKEVEIGVVESIRFEDQYKGVILSAQMTSAAEHLLREDSRFWVVRPRLTAREITGLNTLLSGSYIELDPGKGAKASEFVGLETPPVLTTEDKGKVVLLDSPGLGSLGIGSPIYYQGIVSGEVLGFELADDRRKVLIHAFVKEPYDSLLSDDSQFWNISGIEVSLTADGVKLRTDSLESLMYGGIAFDTPANLQQPRPLTQKHFPLWTSREHLEKSGYTKKVPFVLFFEDSVRGLSVDAPVEFKGIKIGSVRQIRLEYHPDGHQFHIPVLVEIEPERITWIGGLPDEQGIIDKLIKRGLRARLQTGNLLTGQLYVELVMRPDSEVRLLETQTEVTQLPTIPGELNELAGSLHGFLDKLDKVEIDQIAHELQNTLAGTNKLTNHPDLDKAISDMSASMASLKTLLGALEKRSGPISKNLETALGSVAPTLEQAGEAMDSLDDVLKPDSQLHFRVIRMADELTETARSIRALVNVLEHNPQSVIFGKQESE